MWEDVEYFSFTNKFAVKIRENPVRRMEETFDGLEDALAARDARLARLAAKDKEAGNENTLIEKPKKPSKQKTKRRAKKPAHPAIELRSARPEIRNYQATKLSTRKAANGSMQIVGTAICFNSESQDLGDFVEICKYEAVQKSLQRSNDVFILWQHDASQPLGRVKTGSLELTLNRAGLDFVCDAAQLATGAKCISSRCRWYRRRRFVWVRG